MTEENQIGLAELIAQVRRELLSKEIGSDADAPFLSVDEVSLELQVTTRKDAKGGIKIYVLELGGGGGRESAQKVKVTLTPLLTKEERVRLYKAQSPQHAAAFERAVLEATMKGDTDDARGLFATDEAPTSS